jgi:hypothetical protein
MNVKEQLREQRSMLVREVGLHAVNNPTQSFAEMGELFGVNGQWVSRAARAVGQSPRRRGRKAGIAPKKEQVQ